MKYLLLFAFSAALFALEEGSFVQYQEAEEAAQKKEIEQSYQYPLLKEIDGTTEEKTLTLQQRVVDYFGTFVTSSPYPGVRATLDGNDLMSNLSNINKDLKILLELSQSSAFLRKEKIPFPTHPRIFMSGEIEFTGFVQKDGAGHPRSDLNLTDAELDFLIVMAPWIYGFVALEYEDSVDPALSTSRVANSRIKGESIFVTMGDLSSAPWYATFGQTYLPFGQYTTYDAVHSPLTEILFRTIARNVALGFYNNLFHVVTYVYKGDSYVGSGNNVNSYGMSIGCHFTSGQFSGKVAAGAVRNIADSIGMQGVFGDPRNREKLHKVVPGANAHMNLSYGNWNLIGEYNQALRPFDERDATFSTNRTSFKGARPRAFDVELAYAFNIYKRSSSIAFAYSRSFQSLGFNVPRERMTLTWAYHLFRGNLLSVELNSDKLYNNRCRAGGNSVRGNPYFINPSYLGHRDYTLSVDYLIYF